MMNWSGTAAGSVSSRFGIAHTAASRKTIPTAKVVISEVTAARGITLGASFVSSAMSVVISRPV